MHEPKHLLRVTRIDSKLLRQHRHSLRLAAAASIETTPLGITADNVVVVGFVVNFVCHRLCWGTVHYVCV